MSRPWKQKFADAFRGLREGVRGGSGSLPVLSLRRRYWRRPPMLRMDAVQWCVLLLCIAGVLSAEMFNSTLESVARSITGQENTHIRDALDIASRRRADRGLRLDCRGSLALWAPCRPLTGWW